MNYTKYREQMNSIDQKIIEKHLTLIQERSLQEIYKVVTLAIQKKQ